MGQSRGYAHRTGAITKTLRKVEVACFHKLNDRYSFTILNFHGPKRSTAELVSVTPSGLSTLSQYYWIEKIDSRR